MPLCYHAPPQLGHPPTRSPQMSNYIETFRGGVYPGHYDQLGHMNVQHYVGMFDQGTFHLFSAAGFTWTGSQNNKTAFADVNHNIQFIAEQQVGSLILVQGGVTRIGNKSVTIYQKMTNTETGDLAATTEITTVYFDLEARKAMSIPKEMKKGFEKLLVEKES